MTWQSLRLRLLLVSALSTIVALVVTYASLVLIYTRHIDRRVLEELQQRSIELVGALAVDESGKLALDHALSDPRYILPYAGAYWQVSDAEKPLLRSRSLWDKNLVSTPPTAEGPRLHREVGPDGDDLDVLTRTVSLPNFAGGPLAISVAFGRRDVQAQQQAYAVDTAIALSTLAVLLVLGAWLQTGFGLRPLESVRASLAAVHLGRARAIDGPFPDEVEPLVRDLNALLTSQRSQLVRAREQAGDLAHALKTPLTIIEGESTRLAQSDQQGSADLLSEQVEAMRRQVDRVLARARVRGLTSDGAVQTSVRMTVDRLLAVMVRLPRGDALTWRNGVDADLLIGMDGDDFGEVLGNLMDNSRKSARTVVDIRVDETAETLRIVVADDGPGMSVSDQAVLTRRGQTGAVGVAGTGLGLSIVSDLLAAYGSRLEFSTDRQGLFCTSFGLPAGSKPVKPTTT